MKHILMVSVDDGSNESGNPHYCSFLVYDSKDEAVSAAKVALGPNCKVEYDLCVPGRIDVTDDLGNWLLVIPAVSTIELMIEEDA